jgi:hypothetical protein
MLPTEWSFEALDFSLPLKEPLTDCRWFPDDNSSWLLSPFGLSLLPESLNMSRTEFSNFESSL